MNNVLKWVAIRFPLWISIGLIILLFAEFGYPNTTTTLAILDWMKFGTVLLFVICKVIFYLNFWKRQHHIRTMVFDLIVVAYMILTLLDIPVINYIRHPIYLYLGAIAIFFRELGTSTQNFTRRKINPALLFAGSFVLIIVFGTFALMLPLATHSGISFVDAFFTSTSAVCVTGLIVVDTGSYFTNFGQILILILIQAGGLGIMTFTTFFSYFFQGSSTFADQIILRDITRAEQIGNVLGTLTKILYVTFFLEFLGALVIYFVTLKEGVWWDGGNAFFSVFHSISAFCNAGFSTLSESLAQSGFENLYGLHLTIALLFILGGLGFPLLFNMLTYFRYKTDKLVFSKSAHRPWLINLNSRLIIATTLILLITGTILFFAFEYDNVLDGKSLAGKLTAAFFGSATPRTAGFNTVDTAQLTTPALLLVIFLMWVGASPGSTGGGIKTTTISLAFANIISLAKGKERIEIFRREISPVSTRRAFAVIVLSLTIISTGIVLINYLDPQFSLMKIIFECFSAYSTVGLSMGITADLSVQSKLIVIGLMFTGRVGMLTILIALFRKVVTYPYKYPTENILIN